MNVYCSGNSEIRIVIIGGGFTGAAVALNLIKIMPQAALRLTIIEPRENLGAGLAYSTPDECHRTNVPSSRFSILPDEPETLTVWLNESGALQEDPQAAMDDGRVFPRRSVVGAYVGGLLQSAIQCGPARLSHLCASAVNLQKIEKNRYLITLDNDDTIEAEILVIATGHPPPGIPPVLRSLTRHEQFVSNPWRPGVLTGIDAEALILVIGTGLTAADVIAALTANGHRGKILAISRRGLISRGRDEARAEPYGEFSTNPCQSTAALLKRVRNTIDDANAAGFSWAAVIEALRAQGSEVWGALPAAEKHRFLRHLRPYWDVHRYQIAPQLEEVLQTRQQAGTLQMRGARIKSVSAASRGFQVELQSREASVSATSVENCDVIINCTGPDHRNITTTNPLLRAAAMAGLARADEFGLGLDTDHCARAINAAGRPEPAIFIAGPLARATFGELIGVAQIARQARLIACQIKNLLKDIEISASPQSR